MTRYNPDQPLRDVLSALCGGAEPPDFVTDQFFTYQLTEEEQLELQDWCACNVKPEWLTGIGTMEAADALVKEAITSANIAGPPKAPFERLYTAVGRLPSGDTVYATSTSSEAAKVLLKEQNPKIRQVMVETFWKVP